VTERVSVIARVRALAVGIAKAYVDQQSEPNSEAEEEPAKPGKNAKQERLVTVG